MCYSTYFYEYFLKLKKNRLTFFKCTKHCMYQAYFLVSLPILNFGVLHE